MTNKPFVIAILAILTLFSCQKESSTGNNQTTPEKEESKEELVNITIDASSPNIDTKAYYEPYDDNLVAFNWEEGDAMSLIVPLTKNDNCKFTTNDANKESGSFSGDINWWNGEQTIYAIYPYSESGYILNRDEESIEINNYTQSLDYADWNKYSYKSGFMICKSESATVESNGRHSIDDLVFNQTMSIFNIKITDVPDGYSVTRLEFSSESKDFIISARASFADGSIISGSEIKSDKISMNILNHTGGTAMAEMAIIPVDLTGKPIILEITVVNSNGGFKKYNKTFKDGLNFARNSYFVSSEGDFSLENSVDKPLDANNLMLASFDGNYVETTSDKWFILDTEAEAANFKNIRETLNAISKKEPYRNIKITFPNLKVLPDAQEHWDYMLCGKAMTSLTLSVATYIGSNALACSDLQYIDAPKVQSIAHCAFTSSDDLSSITVPDLMYINTDALMGCSSIHKINVDNKFYTFIDNALYSADKSELIYYMRGDRATSYEAPTETTTVHPNAFESATRLTSIKLPNVTTFMDSNINNDGFTFIGCNNLETLEIASTRGTKIKSLASCMFSFGNKMPDNITLTTSNANAEYITNGNSIEVVNKYTFKEIRYTESDDQKSTIASAEKGNIVYW